MSDDSFNLIATVVGFFIIPYIFYLISSNFVDNTLPFIIAGLVTSIGITIFKVGRAILSFIGCIGLLIILIMILYVFIRTLIDIFI